MLAVFALVACLPRAYAAIGEAPATILEAVAAYDPAPADDGTFVAAADVAFRIEASQGLAIRVNGNAVLNDANIRFVSDLLAAATGYGDGIAAPIAEYLRTRTADLVDRGPTPVRVEQFVLTLTVTGTAPQELGFVLEPQVTPAALFPPATHTLGPAEAKHVIREFADFQCPFCERFATTVFPELEEGVLASGDVRFEFHHFPLKSIHPNAFAAAEASECVAAEAGADAFWPYHDTLFRLQDSWVGRADPVDALADLAETAGVSAPGVASCVRSGTYSDVVEAAYDVAVGPLGLTGTPTLFVDGLRVGAYTDLDAYPRLMALSDALQAASDQAASAGVAGAGVEASAPTDADASAAGGPW